MSIEGELLVGLHRGQSGMGVSIRSTRPLAACRVFVGKGPAQLLESLPLLYSICGLAQSAAALAAVEDAAGVAPAPALVKAREAMLLAETAREHAWRVLLDWPAFLGEPPDQTGLAALVQFPKRLARALFRDGKGFALDAKLQVDPRAVTELIDELERLLAERVFGVPPGVFFALDDGEALQRWQAEQQTPAARMLREVAALGWEVLGRTPLAPLPELVPGRETAENGLWSPALGPEVDTPAPRRGLHEPAGENRGLDLTLLESRLGGPEGEAFIAAPDWQGEPKETSPRTRLANHPLLAAPAMRGVQGRLVARLLELAQIPEWLRITLEGARNPDLSRNRKVGAGGGPPQLAVFSRNTWSAGSGAGMLTGFENLSGPPRPDPTGTGIGMVEAARGRLFHRVVLDQGRVRDYRILAPTEWNFHPRGAAALALATLDPGADAALLQRQALLLIHAIDPCVGCRVEIV